MYFFFQNLIQLCHIGEKDYDGQKHLYSEAEELQNFAKGSQINKKYLEMLNNIEMLSLVRS